MEPATDPQAVCSCTSDDEISSTIEYQTTTGETVDVSNKSDSTKPPSDICTKDIYFLHRTSPTFTQLPQDVLMEIMSYLPLHDRYNVSQTCQVLFDVFNHPSLWHTMIICWYGCTDNYVSKETVPCHFVNKFGNFFKHLTLAIKDSSPHEDWVSIMSELSQQCHRLESLTLEVGELIARDNIHGYQPSEKELRAVLSFVRHAFILNKFTLNAWPLHLRNGDLNILSVILQNPKLKDLEILKLFWCESTVWTQRRPILPSPEATLPLVKQFRNLTQLSLRSPMLDTNIIQEMSCPTRSKLKLLQIFTHFVQGDQIFKIPEISTQVWQQFSVANEDVSVECTVLTRTPYSELASMLTPDCPLSAITFMKYSHCDSQILTSLNYMYHHCLKRFACYCDPSADEDEIISLVTGCQQLDQLVYYGLLRHQTIKTIRNLRGHQWKEFVVGITPRY